LALVLQPGFASAEQSGEPAEYWEADIKVYGAIWEGAYPRKSNAVPNPNQAETVEIDAYIALWIGEDGIPYIQADDCVAALFPAQAGVTLETGGQFVADLAYAGSSPRCGLSDGEEVISETHMLMPQSGGYVYSYFSDHTIKDPYDGWGRLTGSALLMPATTAGPSQAYASASQGAVSAPAPPETDDLAAIIDKVIKADSSGWIFNRYDRGSVTNAEFMEQSEDGQSGVVYGEYTYNGGSPGWVKIVMKDGYADCMEYWDFRGQCRPFGTASYGSQLAMGMIVGAMTAQPSSGSESGDHCYTDIGSYDHSGRPLFYQRCD
jgi:hypothetical protein